MTINVPDWCVIGKYVEVKMWDKDYNRCSWFKERIISYSDNGFFHQAYGCPVYHSLFRDYGTTVREIKGDK